MGKGSESMTDQYNIEIQRPVRARRGDSKLIVVVTDAQGKELFRDRADFNEEKSRIRVAKRIAGITGDKADVIDGRLLDKLAQLAQPTSSSGATPGGQTDPYPYEATPGGLIWNKETFEGIVPIPLTTFTAIIGGQAVEDDGVETRRYLEIEATLRKRQYHFQVMAGQFTAMNWPMEHLGAGAALWPGFGIKDHARAAIQFLSGDPPERRVYAHLGWRKIGDTWYCLHSGGAIGPVGPVKDIEVSLPPDLQRYHLPAPPAGKDLTKAIQASLSLLDVAGDSVTVPVYCGIWRAVLGGCDTGIHLVGVTGGGKTEVAAQAQQHYGAEMGSRKLPGSWLSTDNSLETLAFGAKDSLLVVDDFCPTGSQYDVQAMHRKADRLFRGLGNTAGRGRLWSDGTPRPTKPPRAMVLSTGEDVPRGQSLRARMLVVEVPRHGAGAVDWAALTTCQADGTAGLYAQVMAGFVRWLAPQYGDIQRNLQAEITTLREQAYQSYQHRRTPDIMANLAVGLRYFLNYAQQVGALDQVKSEALWHRCWGALGESAAAQQGHQADSDPVARFLELLGAAISSGRAHLSDGDGEAPNHAAAWGWREVEVGTGAYIRTDWRPQGYHIGWLEGEDIYLQAASAFAEVQRLAREAGDPLSVTLPVLKKRLNEQGLLASTEKRFLGDRQVERLDVRKVLQGKRRSVLHFSVASLAPTIPKSAPSVPQTESSYVAGADHGTPNGAQTGDGAGEVCHGNAPSEGITVSREALGGAHGTQNKLDNLLAEKRNAVFPPNHWEEEL